MWCLGRMNTKSHQRARPSRRLNHRLDHKIVRLSPHPLKAHTLQVKWICIWLLHFSHSEDEFSLTALFKILQTLKFKTAAFKIVFRCRQSQTMTFWTRWSKLLFPKSSSKMIEGSEKRKRQLTFELQNSRVFGWGGVGGGGRSETNGGLGSRAPRCWFPTYSRKNKSMDEI